MSSQRGNEHRSRGQKYQNSSKFKNDLHDKTRQQKLCNSLSLSDVCEKCQEILRWKITYKKYKLLKQPKCCVNCKEKKVHGAYRILCGSCSRESGKCPKCLVSWSRTEKSSDILKEPDSSETETVQLDPATS